jgi:hypothetical protein
VSGLSARKRDILSQVADGSLSPHEAAARLEELEREEDAQESKREEGTPHSPPETKRDIQVVIHHGQAEIIGDPSVKEAVADGRHVARREGGVLVIEGEDRCDDLPGFTFSRRTPRWYSACWLIGTRNVWETLTVRMNPNLPLETISRGVRPDSRCSGANPG